MLPHAFRSVFFLFLFLCVPWCAYSDCPFGFGRAEAVANRETDIAKALVEKALQKKSKKHKFTYYLYIADFIESFIEIPTSNVSVDSSTISSTYLAGRAAVYNGHGAKVGTCSASFLCMQNDDGIYTDISNYLSVDSGLIVTWFTPTTLINLELDSIVHSMVTECIVLASTKVGFNPYYGKTFNMVVSSDNQKIYFKLKETHRY